MGKCSVIKMTSEVKMLFWWFCVLSQILVSFVSCSSSSLRTKLKSGEEKCGSGYVLDLNDVCVKRFVVPERIPCPSPEIVAFGGYDLHLKGRMIKFWCESGWKLHPPAHSYAMCKVGEWDKPVPPSCVRPGCSDISLLPGEEGEVELEVDYEMDGAVAHFRCKRPEVMELVGGASTVTCDGQFWNDTTTPHCRKRRPRADDVISSSAISFNGDSAKQMNILCVSVLAILLSSTF